MTWKPNVTVAAVVQRDNKFLLVEEETDETIYWIEVMEESGIVKVERTFELKKECNEILSIIVASINTVRNRINKK